MVRPAATRGVTLIEMMVVMTIIAIMAGVTFPSVASGLDGIRLNTSAEDVATFLNAAMERANRRQVVVALTIDRQTGILAARSIEADFARKYELPGSVSIEAILPDEPGFTRAGQLKTRTIVFYPGGNVPRIGIVLSNKSGARRIVRVDPITGVPQIEKAL
jgi:prepilin-type N-terminal cleavage/methylation domain-containing protein